MLAHGPRQPGPQVMGNVMRTRGTVGVVAVLLSVFCVSCWPRHFAFGTEPLLMVIDCNLTTTITVDADRTVQLSSPDNTLYSKITPDELERLDQILASNEFSAALKKLGTRSSPYNLRCASFSGVVLESSYSSRSLQIEPADKDAVPAVVHDVLEFSSEIQNRLFSSQ